VDLHVLFLSSLFGREIATSRTSKNLSYKYSRY
jgi:hypothetical protein